MFVFIYAALLPLVLGGGLEPCQWCQDHNMNEIHPDPYICHPEHPTSFIECSLVNDTWMGEKRDCPDGRFYSSGIGACVTEALSECAALATRHAHAACEHASTPFVCHDADPATFVYCPRNPLHSAVFKCQGNATFSFKLQKCVPGDAGDCQSPAPSNLAYVHGAPRRELCRPQYIYHPNTASRSNAVHLCRSERAHLASIITYEQQNKIEELYGDQPEFWISATDRFRRKEFRWESPGRFSRAMGYTHWASGYPTGEEHCVVFNKDGVKGDWANADCSIPKPFLCIRHVCKTLPRLPGPRVPLPPVPHLPPFGAGLPNQLFPGAQNPGQGYPPAVNHGLPGQLPRQGIPGQGLPGQLPRQGIPGQGLPGQLPRQGIPGQGLPGQLPRQGIPGQGLPGQGLPGQLPRQGIPGQGLPGQFPGQGLPGQFPGQGLPNQFPWEGRQAPIG